MQLDLHALKTTASSTVILSDRQVNLLHSILKQVFYHVYSLSFNDPSIETQWRAIILFGKNSATYKFAFAKSLIELLNKGQTTVSLEELAVPFSHHILSHLTENDKQGSSPSSKFLNTCRSYQQGSITHDDLIDQTTKLGFVNVVDAFQNVNGAIIKDPFYEKNYAAGKKEIILTDAIHQLKESIQYGNLDQEVDAR